MRNLLQAFATFKAHYGRTYASLDEERTRAAIFEANMRRVDATNAANGGAWTAGVTKFSDLTPDEFSARYTMKVPRLPVVSGTRSRSRSELVADAALLANLPPTVDWVAKGAVTPVKDQGQCGSCWVFGAVGSMEGFLQIAKGLPPTPPTVLSEEEYLACYSSGYAVCNGGDAEAAFRWALTHAICTESSYPYIPPTGKPYPPPPVLHCNASNCSLPGAVGLPQGDVKSIQYVATKSAAALMAAVALGPVSVSVWAGPLQNYRGGIMSGNCMPYQAGDHVMLVTGYGTENGTDFWTIKNSYGKLFGEDGFMRLKRNDSACDANGGIGILSGPVYATVVA
jgi:hypothetical protein